MYINQFNNLAFLLFCVSNIMDSYFVNLILFVCPVILHCLMQSLSEWSLLLSYPARHRQQT